MRILIIGAGNMGRGIATRARVGGHDVTRYDIDPQASRKLANDLADTGASHSTVVTTDNAALAACESDVVVLASWYASNLHRARQLGTALDGKVVVDISNPLNDRYDGLVTEAGTSAAEAIRGVLPGSAKLVKAFSTTFAGTLLNGEVADQPLDVFIAGDDQDAKETIASFVRSAGLNPVDVGALERARQLEALGFLGISMQASLGSGFMSGWKLAMPAGVSAAA